MTLKVSRKHPLLFSLLVAVVMAVGVLLVAASPAQAQQGECIGSDVLETFCLDLQPEEATNPVGTSHTVTATLTANFFGGPFVPFRGTPIEFEVTEGPDAGETGSCITDENGQCTFTFTNTGGSGTDTIVGTIGTTLLPPVTDTVTKTFVEEPQQEEAPQQPQQGVAPAEITQEGEQESEAGEIEQTFDIS